MSVDPMHMRATGRWPGGFFASYHAYPYYPEFLGLDKGYRTYKRPDGKTDPYAGYLHELRAHHKGQAVMITEFGQPTSIGIAHSGPLGRDQGGHSEADSAAKNADMMSAIRRRATPAGWSSNGPTSGSSSRGTRSRSRCRASAGSCGATRSPTRSTSASSPPSPARQAQGHPRRRRATNGSAAGTRP